MSEKTKWSAVLSGKSMRVLSTPFVNHVHRMLAIDFGEETADRLTRHAYQYMNRLDEGGAAETEVEHDLDSYIYPLYGFFEGMVAAGMEPQEAMDYLETMWAVMPEHLKARPWAEE